MSLRTDFQDQVLDTGVNTSRHYSVTNNADNTISLTDVSVYTQEGDDFTAGIINTTNAAVNQLSTDFIVAEGTESGWYYRTWNSGKAEAWQECTGLTYGTQSTINGVRRSLCSNVPALPATFNSINNIQVNGHNSGAWVVASVTGTTINLYNYIISGTTTVTTAYIYVLGTWS